MHAVRQVLPCDILQGWLSISPRHSRNEVQRAGVNTVAFLVPLSTMVISFLFLLSFSDLSLPMLKIFILCLSLSTVEQIMSRERTSSSLYRQAAGYG